MEKGQIFDVELDGVLNKAELLDIIEYKEERYAVYSIENDKNTNNIYVSRIIKDRDGNDELVDIENDEIKSYILRIIHETINR